MDGPLLQIVVVIVWTSVAMEDIHKCLIWGSSFLMYPRGDATLIEINENKEIVFEQVSYGRLVAVELVCVAWLLTSVWTMFLGTKWILFTKSMDSIIHGAVDFGFILGSSTTLFHAFATPSVKAVLNSMDQLPSVFQDSRRLEQAFHIGGACISALLACGGFSLYLFPDIQDMHAVMHEMCGGNLNFVLDRRASTGAIISTGSLPWEVADKVLGATDWELAAHEIVHAQTDSTDLIKYSRYITNRHVFGYYAHAPITNSVELLQCEDLCTTENCNGQLLNVLRVETGNVDGNTCEDLKEHCTRADVRGIRRLCPSTCGCGDRTAPQFLYGPFGGCPESCYGLVKPSLAKFECKDQTVEDLAGKEDVWNTITKQIDDFADVWHIPGQSSHMRGVGASLRAQGCGLLTTSPESKIMLCGETHQALGSLHAYCPLSCGCDKRVVDSLFYEICPTSCDVRN